MKENNKQETINKLQHYLSDSFNTEIDKGENSITIKCRLNKSSYQIDIYLEDNELSSIETVLKRLRNYDIEAEYQKERMDETFKSLYNDYNEGLEDYKQTFSEIIEHIIEEREKDIERTSEKLKFYLSLAVGMNFEVSPRYIFGKYEHLNILSFRLYQTKIKSILYLQDQDLESIDDVIRKLKEINTYADAYYQELGITDQDQYPSYDEGIKDYRKSLNDVIAQIEDTENKINTTIKNAKEALKDVYDCTLYEDEYHPLVISLVLNAGQEYIIEFDLRDLLSNLSMIELIKQQDYTEEITLMWNQPGFEREYDCNMENALKDYRERLDEIIALLEGKEYVSNDIQDSTVIILWEQYENHPHTFKGIFLNEENLRLALKTGEYSEEIEKSGYSDPIERLLTAYELDLNEYKLFIEYCRVNEIQ